jgi:hypothetical protein
MSTTSEYEIAAITSYFPPTWRLLDPTWIEFDDESAMGQHPHHMSGVEATIACRDGLAVREIVMQYSGETLLTMRKM